MKDSPDIEAKIRNLEMIQEVINRMAGNLFYLKGWSITLVVGLFALASSKDANPIFAVMAFLPLFVFWILDGYFLSMERSFRDMYNDVRKRHPRDIDFDLNPQKYKDANPRNGWICSLCSKTLVWFYLPIVVTSLLVFWKLLTIVPSVTH
jgi:hypothetical protein